MAKIEFNDTEFRFSHGHAPRGRGSWAFAAPGVPGCEEVFFTPGGMLFSEAKKFAKAKVAEGVKKMEQDPHFVTVFAQP